MCGASADAGLLVSPFSNLTLLCVYVRVREEAGQDTACRTFSLLDTE